MYKIIILAVIAVSSAQFGEETFRVNTDELRVNQANPGETLRLNPRHRHRNTETVGGFQNGNFAQHNGRLRTNLDSSRIVTDDRNSRPREIYIEEGAAFIRPVGQFDVHSSQGRADYIVQGNNDNNERNIQNFGTQNGERFERPSENQRNQYVNTQNNNRQNVNGESESRNVNNDQIKFNTENTERNNQRNNNNDRIDFDQNTRDQNIDYNTQNYQNRNDNNGKTNFDQSNTRQNRPNNNNAHNNDQNRFNNQDNQQTNQNQRNQNGANIDETISKIDSQSRSIAERVTRNRQNYDREAMDREINNQITKMIFDESVQPEATTKKITKTTQDNELSRGNSGKEDKWIWSDGTETTKAPTTPDVDDRAAFAGDQCPTGQKKFNNVCVDVDP